MCAAIFQDFTDARSVAVLLELLNSGFGISVVLFILNLVAMFGFRLNPDSNQATADWLIGWNLSDCGAGAGGCNFGGPWVILDPSADLVTNAAALTHEEVEVYYSLADGIPGDSYQMDYVAEWFQGMVACDLGSCDSGRSYGMNYKEWLDPNGNDALDGYSGDISDPELTGIDNRDYAGNPMGLTTMYLSWEGNPYNNPSSCSLDDVGIPACE
jgi:hypothetical protein